MSRLRVVAASGNIPHMLLTGPPGVGKTTAVLALVAETLATPPDGGVRPHLREAVLELNASDERGIDVVRSQIKAFATKRVAALPPNRHKVVILDEADAMTAGAQQALRRIMEVHAATTRFVLACNNSSKIIEPIQSRCAILRFGRLSQEAILGRLVAICAAEAVPYTPDGLEALLFTCDGDMRQAINNLQATAAGFGLVSGEHVYRVCDAPHPHILRAMLAACAAAHMEASQGAMEGLLAAGYAPLDIVASLFRVARTVGPGDAPGGGALLEEALQLEYIRAIGTTHMRLLEGVASRLQLMALLANLCLLSTGLPPIHCGAR